MSNHSYPNQHPIQDKENEIRNRSHVASLLHDIYKTIIPNKQKMEDARYNEDYDNQIMYDNEIFGDILTKMKDLVETTDKKICNKNHLTEAWQILNDLLTQLERFEQDLKDEDVSTIQRETCMFCSAMCYLDPTHVLQNDIVYAKEIFYMYFNLLNHPRIQSQKCSNE
jgi:hypothetical protein